MVAMFPLGRILATPGVLRALERANQSGVEFLERHAARDWGELDREALDHHGSRQVGDHSAVV
jgi:hypothetical protein